MAVCYFCRKTAGPRRQCSVQSCKRECCDSCMKQWEENGLRECPDCIETKWRNNSEKSTLYVSEWRHDNGWGSAPKPYQYVNPESDVVIQKRKKRSNKNLKCNFCWQSNSDGRRRCAVEECKKSCCDSCLKSSNGQRGRICPSCVQCQAQGFHQWPSAMYYTHDYDGSNCTFYAQDAELSGTDYKEMSVRSQPLETVSEQW